MLIDLKFATNGNPLNAAKVKPLQSNNTLVMLRLAVCYRHYSFSYMASKYSLTKFTQSSILS